MVTLSTIFMNLTINYEKFHCKNNTTILVQHLARSFTPDIQKYILFYYKDKSLQTFYCKNLDKQPRRPNPKYFAQFLGIILMEKN